MTSNVAQAGCTTVTCEMMFAPCPANLFEIFKKIMQKLNLGLIPFVKHMCVVYLPKSLLASCKEHMHGGVMHGTSYCL